MAVTSLTGDVASVSLESLLLDIVFVLGMIALFALVGLVARGVEKL